MSSEGQTEMPQAAGAQPIGKPSVSPELRHELARQLVNSIHHVKPMDPDFDPLHATAKELQAHGVPSRPGSAAPPEQVAAWEEIVLKMKSMELVNPVFEIIDREIVSTAAERPEAKTATGSTGLVP